MAENWLEEIGREAIERFGGEPLKARAREEMRRVSEDLGQRVVVLETEVGGMKGAITGMERKLSEMEIAMEKKLSAMETVSEKRGAQQSVKLDMIATQVIGIHDWQVKEDGRREALQDAQKTANRGEDRRDNWVRAMLPYISAILALAAIGWVATHPTTRIVDVSVEPVGRP